MSLTVTLKVTPQSGKLSIYLDKNGTLKCYLKSAPEKGAANRELIKHLAKLLGVTQDVVEIIGGALERKKTIKIHKALTYEDFLRACGLDQQAQIF